MDTRHAILPCSAIAAALLLALPSSAAAPSAPPTRVWIDVATHHMAGMPDMEAMGGLGAMAARMAGGPQQALRYPDTRMPMMTGRYLDIALHNSLNPGVAAQQQVPAGLGLGNTLPLLPPVREGRPVERDEPWQPPEGQQRILFYWGCGSDVRTGQPRVLSLSAKDGKVEFSGQMQRGRYAPDRDIEPDPKYALWPNPQARQRVPRSGSLVGGHHITGAGVPASLQFELQQTADFMPAIDLRSSGTADTGLAFSWPAVDRAQGYFLHAVGIKGKDVVIWSSAEVPEAGQGLVDYLPGSHLQRWLREKVLLPASTTSCTIPKGIYQAAGEDGGGGIVSMIAYGPETQIVWPPKPADPKQAWKPEWSVRVRTKSTAGAMLGMDLSGLGADQPADPDAEQAPKESGPKKLLRGLLRNL